MSVSNKQFLNKRERVLLLNSEVFKDELYKDYRELLTKNKRITNGLIDSLPTEQQIFFRTAVKSVIKEAIKEWQADKQKVVEDKGLGNTDIKCSLCGTGNRYIFYIKNRVNGKRLNVGSDCIEDFVKEGFQLPESVAELKRNATKVHRRIKLNYLIPNVHDKIVKWDKFIEEQDIYIPREITKSYNQLKVDTTNLYNQYIDNKIKIDCAEEICNNFKRKEELEIKLRSYVKRHKDKPFIATRDIINHLKRTRNSVALRMIEDDNGNITSKSAPRITENNFVEFIMPLLNKALEKKRTIIKGMDFDTNKLVFTVEPLHRVKLSIGYQQFMQEVGMVIFGEEPIEQLNRNYLLTESKVNDSVSYEILTDRLKQKLRKKEVKIVFTSHSESELIIYYRKTDSYYLYDLRDFVDQNKILAYQDIDSLFTINLTDAIKILDKKEFKMFKEAKRAAYEMEQVIK
ncbi:hypothetical protein [Bacillus sp. FJAT-45350]|uniref:hypothetical protein n=1 Tax=Bacillus sp. FJAT-45350 TaxID=2011014 RepID=UPI000BB74F6C|nr:hypothetical protein [Bacillus sp. FJAT-45350]